MAVPMAGPRAPAAPQEAALRRFTFKIKFMPLTAAQRERMFVTEALAGELVADEHFVVVCSHTQGHTPPPGFTDLINAWIPAHSYGRHSPFEEDLSGLSDICRKFE